MLGNKGGNVNVTGGAMVELGAGAGRNVFGNAFGRERGAQEHARWRANDGAFEGGRGCGCCRQKRGTHHKQHLKHTIERLTCTRYNASQVTPKTHQQWIFARKALRAHLTLRAKKFKNKDSERRCKRMPCVHGV